MTAEALDPAPDPVVDVLANLMRQVWPDLTAALANRHAASFVRVARKYCGEPDMAATARLSVLLAPPGASEPTVDPDAVIELPYGGLFLRPWTAEMDRRPKTKTPRWADPEWAPGGPRRYGPSQDCTGSARHGECTPCGKANVLSRAVYRVSGTNDTYSRESLCDRCARKRLGGPVVVPQFSSPEEAQAWLDAQE